MLVIKIPKSSKLRDIIQGFPSVEIHPQRSSRSALLRSGIPNNDSVLWPPTYGIGGGVGFGLYPVEKPWSTAVDTGPFQSRAEAVRARAERTQIGDRIVNIISTGNGVEIQQRLYERLVDVQVGICTCNALVPQGKHTSDFLDLPPNRQSGMTS